MRFAEEFNPVWGRCQSTIERKRLDMPHLTAFRHRLRELRALSRSAFTPADSEKAGARPNREMQRRPGRRNG